MDIYHVWCDLKPGVSDLEFVNDVKIFLTSLKEQQSLSDFRITRAKLGLKPADLREFHIMLEFVDLSALQATFETVSSRTDPIESLHFAVNSKACNVKFALYRDFPDPGRKTGGEKF